MFEKCDSLNRLNRQKLTDASFSISAKLMAEFEINFVLK